MIPPPRNSRAQTLHSIQNAMEESSESESSSISLVSIASSLGNDTIRARLDRAETWVDNCTLPAGATLQFDHHQIMQDSKRPLKIPKLSSQVVHRPKRSFHQRTDHTKKNIEKKEVVVETEEEEITKEMKILPKIQLLTEPSQNILDSDVSNHINPWSVTPRDTLVYLHQHHSLPIPRGYTPSPSRNQSPSPEHHNTPPNTVITPSESPHPPTESIIATNTTDSPFQHIPTAALADQIEQALGAIDVDSDGVWQAARAGKAERDQDQARRQSQYRRRMTERRARELQSERERERLRCEAREVRIWCQLRVEEERLRSQFGLRKRKIGGTGLTW